MTNVFKPLRMVSVLSVPGDVEHHRLRGPARACVGVEGLFHTPEVTFAVRHAGLRRLCRVEAAVEGSHAGRRRRRREPGIADVRRAAVHAGAVHVELRRRRTDAREGERRRQRRAAGRREGRVAVERNLAVGHRDGGRDELEIGADQPTHRGEAGGWVSLLVGLAVIGRVEDLQAILPRRSHEVVGPIALRLQLIDEVVMRARLVALDHHDVVLDRRVAGDDRPVMT